MKREIRIILSIIVLLVGLITAALFQPAAQSTPEEDNSGIAVRETPSYGQNVSYTEKTRIPTISAQKVHVPALPTSENLLPVPATSQTVRRESDLPKPRTTRQDPVPELPTSFPNIKTSLQPIPIKRIHTIVDGDTLQSLASRYLDSESRWEEIYQVNRTLLDDSTLLPPIGTKLTIPPRTPYPKQASQPKAFPASSERPVSHTVAKPLEILPNEPMVPMTQ